MTPHDTTDPQQSYGYQTRATHRAFDRLLQRQLAQHGLQNGFWYVLRVLWREEGMTQRELAEAVNLTESSNGLRLERMEQAGLVRRRRDPHDKRRVRVHLTAKARRLEAALLPYAELVNAAAAEGISARDLAAYLRVARRMQANLKRALESA